LKEEEEEQVLSPQVKPEVRATRNWRLVGAVACVVAMLLVTAAQVVVEVRSVRPAVLVSVAPLPTAVPAAPAPSSMPIAYVASAAPAPPSAPPAVSLAPVVPRAPVARKPPPAPRGGEIVDPWGSAP
jgi:hypothetical protein